MTEPVRRKLRVGLLLDSMEMPSWRYSMLEQIKSSDYASIALIVMNGSEPISSSAIRRRMADWHYLAYMAYTKLDAAIFQPEPDAFTLRSATELLADIPTITARPRQTRYTDVITDKDIEQICGYAIDFFIRLGFRILKGRILETAPFGVWSFHHGDNRINRGGPAGFWEVFEGHPTTGSVLQILTPDLDNGRVLARTYSTTDNISVARNRNSHYWKTLSLLSRQLKRLHELGGETFLARVGEEAAAPRFYSRRLYRRPRNLEFMWLLARLMLRHARRKAGDALFVEQWTLMFDRRAELSTSLWRFEPLVPPKDRFWADPHMLYKDGRYYVFVEECLYAPRKGHIAVLIMEGNGDWTGPTKVLEEAFHVSHPFVFEWEGGYYMIPETCAAGVITAYRCVDFPFRWEKYATLMENVEAVDTTLLQHGGKWWLFANVRENKGASTWDELSVFYADSPLSTSWSPHPENPVVSDVRRARPAGRFFAYEGKIYRPSQDCSKTYGYAIKINEVVKLNESEYVEKEVDSIEPAWSKEVTATHTLAHTHGLTIIDARVRRRRF